MPSFHNKHEDITNKIYSGELIMPHRYVFVLTNLCNLDCNFCFQDRDRRDDAMTTQDWLNVVKQLPEYARVTFTGGEPLAFKDFEVIVNAVADKHECNIITNGLLLSEKKIDFILSKPNFKVLSISIDDIGNLNRDVKPRQWQSLLAVIDYFHLRKKELKSDCILDIKTVVLDKNSSDLFSIHKYCVEVLKANTHAFQFLKGSHLQHSDKMHEMIDMYTTSNAPTYQHFDVILQQLEMIRQFNQTSICKTFVHPKICDLSSSQPIPKVSFINSARFKPQNYQACKFPWSSVHINVDGHLFPCIAVSMGNVKTTKLIDIIEGDLFKEFKSALSKHLVEGCNRCGWIRPNDNMSIINTINVE
ncbi:MULTISPECIES: radical SAM protein [unclassified Pseudoalteromonas]|uniref:radical SAM protein n=1 Tax=unclassified Pseudoalteromonas TaxID=194690 RepID=UPI000C06F922|nr:MULTISPECIES: radical SAM protein [unclassified Pseudoalteromonas]MDP2635440.1 radical SAM protein [Pseudoalteromonas sp. 1_MG-2023]PHN88821.1 hypothetical protein CSC79_16000 [Pseudoalteromonas sp. 3D05]